MEYIKEIIELEKEFAVKRDAFDEKELELTKKFKAEVEFDLRLVLEKYGLDTISYVYNDKVYVRGSSYKRREDEGDGNG